jgi:hypothetical protein
VGSALPNHFNWSVVSPSLADAISSGVAIKIFLY